MFTAIKNTGHEIRGILADMSTATTHPPTLERPTSDAGAVAWLMHSVHSALYHSGRLANMGYDRKTPRWPVEAAPKSISVLGYGFEKVAYQVSAAGESDQVVSVYHRESIGKEPQEVAQKKRETYKTYQRYFGELVVPTVFAVIDNPWGSGGKPAAIQPLLTRTDRLAVISTEDLLTRAANNPELKYNARLLIDGYYRMLKDGLCPDFASSNLLLSGPKIHVFDTGVLYPTSSLPRLHRRHSNYGLMRSLAQSGQLQ